MIRSITLHNFMSHEATELELGGGLTVLTGPNNCGKSAVVTALQVLCTNESATYVTRHGAKECTVTVETDDGHVVRWGRKNSPRYEIDGELFDRLGRSGVPDELHRALRMPLVGGDDGPTFNIHFGEQKSPVFLLDQPGSQAARFFASSSDAGHLIEMQRRHKQKVADAVRERTRLQAERAREAAAVAALDAVDPLDARLSRLEADHAALLQRDTQIDGLDRSLARLRRAEREVELLGKRLDRLHGLTAPPVLPDPTPLVRLAASLRGVRRRVDRQAARAEALVGLAGPPRLRDPGPLARLTAALRRSRAEHRRGAALAGAVENLDGPPHLHDVVALGRLAAAIRSGVSRVTHHRHAADATAALTAAPALSDPAPLRRRVDELRVAAAERRRRDAACAALQKLPAAPPQPFDDRPLTRLRDTLGSSVAEAGRLDAEVFRLDEAMERARREAEQLARARPTCPTCGGPVDAARLLAVAVPGVGGEPDA